MKRKLIILPVAATMIVVGIFTAGAVMAQGNDTNGTDTTPAVQSFASRVASILGLDETTVQNAMDQAHKDMQDEAMKAKLDAMVEQGRLTQEQADSYYQWYQDRPEGLQGFGGPGMGFDGYGHGMRGEGPGFGFGRRGHGMWGPEGMFGAPQGTAPSQSPSQSDSGSNNGTAF